MSIIINVYGEKYSIDINKSHYELTDKVKMELIEILNREHNLDYNPKTTLLIFEDDILSCGVIGYLTIGEKEKAILELKYSDISPNINLNEINNLYLLNLLIVSEYVSMNKHNIYDIMSNSSVNGYLDIIKYFVERGADVNMKDDNGYTFIAIASKNGHLNVIKYLVEKGVDINVSNVWNLRPIYYAVIKNHLEIVKYFIEKSVDINMQYGVLGTPLHIASKNGNLEIVKHLVENGASICMVDSFGNTPLGVAYKNKHIDVIEFLKSTK